MPVQPKQLLTRLILVTCVLALVSGCAGAPAEKGEPSGGSWTPILMASNDAVRPGVPPTPDSEAQKSELAELMSLQSQRTAGTDAAVEFWNLGATLRWNEIARGLVAKYRTDPPSASRMYALLSVAQYDALVLAWNNKYTYNRGAPASFASELEPLVSASGDPVYPSEHAVVASVSTAVLTYFYPDEAGFLAGRKREDEESRLWAGANFRSDITAGDTLGAQVAQTMLAHARADRSDAAWTGTLPVGAGYWFSDPDEAPLLPEWGQVNPWLMTAGDQFRPGPPPAFDSAEFKAALAEVKRISDTRTPEQARIAAIWADNLGTYTPPGHWNAIAAKLIQEHKLNEIRSARAMALLNMAVMDAGIACWETKYYYFLIRPSQVDPSITTPVGLPNFPAYTSGHAAFSGAAAEVLAYLFPDQADKVNAMAEEAAVSRLYGGIHYQFDNDVGLETGRAVGKLAIERGRADGSP